MEIAIKLLVLVVVQGALSSDNESHLWSRISHKDPHDDEWIHEGGRLRRRSLLSVEPPEGSEELPPLFQDDYDAEIEVRNLASGESYIIHEVVVRDSVWLRMTKKNEPKVRTCSYSKLSGFGHTIYGLECLPAVNLPSSCFCSSSDPRPTPYLPLTDILGLVAKKGVDRSQVVVDTNRFTSWHVKSEGIDLTAAFVNYGGQLSDDRDQLLAPFSITVEHNTSNPNYFSGQDHSCGGNLSLKYTVHKWHSPSSAKSYDGSTPSSKLSSFGGGAAIKSDWTIAPEGVFCQRPDIYRKKLPDIPDHFSVKIETVDESQDAVTFTEEHYDFGEKLVAFEFAPRSHSPPAIFFSRFTINPGYPNDLYRVVHDFAADLQYTLNERTGNCSVREIPEMSSTQLSRVTRDVTSTLMDDEDEDDKNEILINTEHHTTADYHHDRSSSVVGTLRHVRLRHARELLAVDPQKFVYSGSRSIRGIPCDVWVAEAPEDPKSPEYRTIELYFSRPDWHILVEEVNPISTLPLGMRTYIADSKNSSTFDKRITSHYFEFNPSRPMWKFFDVSTCLARLDKLYLKLTLDVSYTLLVQFSLQKAHDSIRKAIAGISGISPLRISHLHLSAAPGDTEAIDVWFVMLDRPIIEGSHASMISKKRLLSISEAYRNLAQLIAQRDIPLKLPLNSEREVVARLRKHSLQVAPESVYPSAVHRGSYRFLRATYTAGSMAGLGFSMAILGICIGIFLGFLLWKRRLGIIPYYLSP